MAEGFELSNDALQHYVHTVSQGNKLDTDCKKTK